MKTDWNLAKITWNEGTRQVKEGPAGVGGRKCSQQTHVSNYFGRRPVASADIRGKGLHTHTNEKPSGYSGDRCPRI